MSKRRRRTRSRNKATTTRPRNGEEFVLLSYDIVDEPIKTDHNIVPKQVQDEMADLHECLHNDPRSAIHRLVTLRDQYPKVPILSNLLAAAYERIGDRDAGRQVVEDNYHNDPDYLFAKINYAQMCILDGKLEKIPEIFDKKYDLKLLYPKRKKFHVTEFMGFTGVISVYFSLIGQQDIAKRLFEALVELDPDSPSVGFARVFIYPRGLKQKIQIWAMRKSQQLKMQDIERARIGGERIGGEPLEKLPGRQDAAPASAADFKA